MPRPPGLLDRRGPAYASESRSPSQIPAHAPASPSTIEPSEKPEPPQSAGISPPTNAPNPAQSPITDLPMPEKIGAARSALERSGIEVNVRFRLVVPLTLLAVAGGGAKHAHRAAASHAAPPTTPLATLRRVAHLRRLRGRPLFWLGRR